MRPNVKYCDILKYRIFFISISVLGTLSSLYAEQTTNRNSILETIVQGVSYRDSLIKSVVVNFNFEKYGIFECGANENDTDNKNYSWKGKACFFTKDDKMRLDMDYIQTVYAGSTDPHGGGGGKIFVIKKTDYYSPNSLQTLDKTEKKLTIEASPVPLPSLLPLSFGLNWDTTMKTNIEVRRFGDVLSNLMKQGVLSFGGEEVFEGTKCYVLERAYSRGKVKLWIAPSKGYSTMRMTISELASKGDSKRELIMHERVCTVTNIAGDLWFPLSGVEKYYSVSRSSTTIENIKLYIDRETRIDVTGYELNKVSDNDVTPPDSNSGEYNEVWDVKINKLIRLKKNPH